MKYLLLDETSLCCKPAGITHHRNNLFAFICVALWKNYTPIMPKLQLAKFHNNNNNCNILSEYFDFVTPILMELPSDIDKDDIIIWKPEARMINNDTLYKEYIANTSTKILYSNVFNYKLEFKHIAQEILSKLSEPVCCIHIRRSDYLKIKPSLLETTTPENVAKKLDMFEGKYKSVYIMTSENDRAFYTSIRDKYNIKQYYDFPELEKIETYDNYKLFCIETYIRDLSQLRISTFNTQNTHYYSGYLDESIGWQ